MTILTRSAKGSELSWAEGDENLTDLRDRPNGQVRPKTKGIGTKIDLTTPTWPWRDLEGTENPRPTIPNKAELEIFRGTVRQWAFAVDDMSDNQFHIPHDYAPGTDLYIHVHWSHIGTAISGQIEFTFNHMYAKGHQQAEFGAEKSVVFSLSTPDIATIPQYRHMITEAQLSSSAPTAAQIDNADLEPDGMILCNLSPTVIPAITGSLGNKNMPFILQIDIHYQSTEIGTKAKEPDFWT